MIKKVIRWGGVLYNKIYGTERYVYLVTNFNHNRIWVTGGFVSSEEAEGNCSSRHFVDDDGDYSIYFTWGGPRDGDVGGDFAREFLLPLG